MSDRKDCRSRRNDNYELQFKGHPNYAFATITPAEGKSVPVLVWELKAKDEQALDWYEGFPRHYFKKDIPVKVNGQGINAMAYIMNLKQDFGIPTQRYYNTVREGYENCKFDVSILNEAVDKSIAEYRKLEASRPLSLFEDADEDEPEEQEPEEEPEEEPDEADPFCSDQLHW